MPHPAHAQRISAFSAWFQANGGYISPLTEFVHSPDKGIHLRAKPINQNPIPAGTLIVNCPHHLSLSALNAVDKPPTFDRNPRRGEERTAPALPERFCQEAPRQSVAAVWICIQWLLRQEHRAMADIEGPYDAYLDILPAMPLLNGDSTMPIDEAVDVIDTPMWWSGDEISWITDTNLEKGIRDLEQHWQAQWAEWQEDLTTWCSANNFNISWRLFKWALTILGSRSFSSKLASRVLTMAGEAVISDYDPQMLLYPGLDMLNHSPLTSNRWSTDGESFGLLCDDLTPPGQEIYNSYGGKGNSELFLSFGFCLKDNPHDSFDLKLPERPIPLLERIIDAGHPDPVSHVETPSAGAIPSYFSTDGTVRPNQAPPASIPENNLYSIRSRNYLSSAFGVREGFGDPSALPQAPWISSVPRDLLNILSASLANRHETAFVMDNLSDISSQNLYQNFRGRNHLAVGNVLLDRFKHERSKMMTTAPLSDPKAFPVVLDPRVATVEDRRRYYTYIYCDTKMRILAENIAALEEYKHNMLTGDASLSYNTGTQQLPLSRHMDSSSQRGNFPYAITFNQALESLRDMPSDVYSNFVTGITQVLRLVDIGSRKAVLEGPWAAWALWLGVVLSFTNEAQGRGTSGPSASTQAGQSERAPGMDDRMSYPALRRWCDFIHRTYRPFESPQSSINHPSPEPSDPASLEPSEQDEELAEELEKHILMLRQVSPQNPLWAGRNWPPGFWANIVDILQEETIDIGIALGDQDVINATVFWVGVD